MITLTAQDIQVGPPEQIAAMLVNPEVYSYSRLALFIECRRKHHYRYGLNLGIPQGAPAADFGTVLHIGLGTLYQTGGDMGRAMEALRTTWDKLFGALPATNFPQYYAKTRAEDIFIAYCLRYKNENWHIPPQNVELGFIVRIEDFYIVGKMDLLPEMPAGSGLWYPFDHKSTTSSLSRDQDKDHSAAYFAQYELDFQTTAYTYATRKLLGTNGKCPGAYINAVGVPKVQTLEQKHFTFGRHLFHKNSVDLQEWEQECVDWVADVRRARDTGKHLRNTKACSNFGRCGYKDLCTTHMNQGMLSRFPQRQKRELFHFEELG